MKPALSENMLFSLSEFISTNLALNFKKDRWTDLERHMESAAKEFGFDDVEKFIQHIMSSTLTRDHIELLTAHLTNNETYFWREPQTFEALEKTILPELVRQRQSGKRIRIWSAGCSTGEEPYSIAIALSRVIPDLKDWNITILATDISPRILQRASAGLYRQWSFRGVPAWLQKQYFIPKENDMLEIVPQIKSMVKFEYLNLAFDGFPSPVNNTNAMDIIFCRNVLLYFTRNRISQILHGLYHSLLPEGYLVVAASELSLVDLPDCAPFTINGMIVHRKTLVTQQLHSYMPAAPEVPEEILSMNDKSLPSDLVIEIADSENTNQTAGSYSPQEEALLSYTQGNYADVIEKLPLHDRTTDEQKLLIRALVNQGKFPESISECEKAIASDKLDPRLYFLYATIMMENNQIPQAVQSLQRAIFLDSNFVLPYYSLGNIYRRAGNNAAAQKCFSNAVSILKKCPNDEILPESEGLTAGRLKEIVRASLQPQAA